MTRKFRPGDRVSTRSGRIGRVIEAHKRYAVVEVGYKRPLPYAYGELRAAFQDCKDCDGRGFRVENDFYDGRLGGRPLISGTCATCRGAGRINRTGPYRLASGAWSDGVNRKLRVSNVFFNFSNPNRVTVSGRNYLLDQWRAVDLEWEVYRHEPKPTEPVIFDKFAEAVAHADRMARKGNK